MIDRITYYMASQYASQIEEGGEYGEIKRTICIGILDFEVRELKGMEEYSTRWRIIEDKYRKKVLTEKMEIYIPMHHVQKMIQGKKKRVLEPLLPNIIFVYTTPKSIVSFVKENPQNTFINFYFNHFKQDEYGKNPPLTIGYNEMMNFINITSMDNEHIRVIEPEQCRYKSGDLVRVTDGDFKGVTGRVARVAGQQRVVVELKGLCLVATAYVPSAFLMKIK